MSETIPAPPKKPIPPTPPIPPTLTTKPVPPQKTKGKTIKRKKGTSEVVSPSVLKGHSSVNASNREITLFYPSLYGGRFTRAQYWCYYITGLFLSPIFSIVFFWAESLHFVPFSIFYGLPITVKRIHDLGYSAILPISIIFGVGALGLWALHNEMLIIGFIAAIILFVFTIWIGFFDSQEGANSYGDSVKYPDLYIKLRDAVLKKDEEKIVFLLKIGAGKYIDRLDKEGISLLHVATKKGYTEVVKLLAAAGVNVNKSDKNGETPLNMTSREGNTEVLKGLIASGADINQIIKDGQTMLHLAARKGNIRDVKLLLSKSADVNVQDRDRRTPLHCAIYNEYIDIAKLLIEAGADFNITDKYGWTPLKAASDKGHTEIVELLKAAGAKE